MSSVVLSQLLIGVYTDNFFLSIFCSGMSTVPLYNMSKVCVMFILLFSVSAVGLGGLTMNCLKSLEGIGPTRAKPSRSVYGVLNHDLVAWWQASTNVWGFRNSLVHPEGFWTWTREGGALQYNPLWIGTRPGGKSLHKPHFDRCNQYRGLVDLRVNTSDLRISSTGVQRLVRARK